MKTITKAAILLGLNSLLIGSVLVKQANSCIRWKNPPGNMSQIEIKGRCTRPSKPVPKPSIPEHNTYFFTVFNAHPRHNMVIKHENSYHVIPARSFKTLTSTIGKEVLLYADRRKDLHGFNQIVYQFDAAKYNIVFTYDSSGYIKHKLMHD